MSMCLSCMYVVPPEVSVTRRRPPEDLWLVPWAVVRKRIKSAIMIVQTHYDPSSKLYILYMLHVTFPVNKSFLILILILILIRKHTQSHQNFGSKCHRKKVRITLISKYVKFDLHTFRWWWGGGGLFCSTSTFFCSGSPK